MALFAKIRLANGETVVRSLEGLQQPHLKLPQGARVEVFDSLSGKALSVAKVRKLVEKHGEELTVVSAEHGEVTLVVTHDTDGGLTAGVLGNLADIGGASSPAASTAEPAPAHAGAGSDAGPVGAGAGGGLSAPVIALIGAGLVGGGIALASGHGKDKTAPAAPTGLDLAAADDTGASSTDNLTRNASGLTISGTAEAGAKVELLVGTSVVGSGVAGADGTFSIDATLAAGASTVTARATDKAGNVSPVSAGITITVDATAPSAPTGLDLAAADDTGAASNDDVTDQTSALTISGTAEAASSVELFDGATSLGKATAGANGGFTLDVSLAAGTHAITAKATDAAGNASAASGALNLTVAAVPSLLGSSIDGNGDIVTLYFSEALDTAHMPAAGQFAIDNGGAIAVSSVQVNGNRVTLQLASAVNSASPVKVSFTDASAANDANTVQDIAGNDAASFANAVVTNKLSLVGSQASDFAPVASLKLAGAEISAYDAASGRFFVTSNAGLQVVKLNADMTLTSLGTIALGTNDVTSVSVKNGVVAAAVVDADKTKPGTVYFIKADGDPAQASSVLGNVKVGSLPDMLTFTADGKKVLVANEGEQDTAGVNPVGSVSIIDLSGGVAAATVKTASFDAFNDKLAALKASGVRLFAGNAGFENITVAQDLEPEYISVSPDGTFALVTLQENNAVGVLDIASGTFVDIVALGLKSFLGLPVDGSDRDGAGATTAITLQTDQPFYGQFMPDGIASFTGADGKTYFIIANEGDDRDDFITPDETARVSALNLDPAAFPNGAALKTNAEIGRLTVSNAPGNNGDTDGDGDIEKILAYGARSFSILNEDGVIVFDSGSQIEQFVAARGLFTDGSGTGLFDDTRSDNKGPEPEGVTIGKVGDRTLAFIGLERGGGGVMVYDVTDVSNIKFVQYIRQFGDVAPEGVLYVSAADSPTGQALVVTSNEASNTITVYANAATAPVVEQAAIPTSFLAAVSGRAAFEPVINAGETAKNGYVFDGTPDGIGAYDNGDGTLTVLVNHEFGATAGAVRAHGSVGAYVSQLIIDKATLSVVSGKDLLSSASNLYLATADGKGWTSGTTTAFNRFCSADLALLSAYKTDTLGYNGRIFLTGEEAGNEGRGFAFIATGTEAGKVYELAALGNLSFENLVANPLAQTKTIVAETDDTSTNGQVYFYVGTKLAPGNAVEQAGLAGGKLFGVKIGMATAGTETGVLATPTETSLGLVNGQSTFSLVDLGDVSGKSGATINAESITAGVTNFLRPEDGAWSLDGKTFYFVTTASPTTASRLWALEFKDIANPEQGGTVKLLLDGSEGQVMFDNITIADDGTMILQEDPGNIARAAKIWKYAISTDTLTEIAQHDPALFTGTGAITQDEESSGVVDIGRFLTGVAGYDTAKYNYFMVADQIHKGVTNPASQVEMGQLTVMATAKGTDNPAAAFPADPDYLVGTAGRAVFEPIIVTPAKAANGYVFDGTPDGIGAYDNGDGTMTVLVNHEFGATAGAVRAHGSAGAYVSKLIVDKATLAVVSGSDLLASANDLFLTNAAGVLQAGGTTTAFNRFCSADLALQSAFLNGAIGYNGRIFLTGEEAGGEGRAFAFVATGADAGKAYELSSLGNLSFENVVANPFAQARTIVAETDDTSTNGQVYFYVGNKVATGNAIEQAGLTGGNLFGVKVGTLAAGTETGALTNPTETGLGLVGGQASFSLVSLGDVKAKDGATINAESIAAGVTNFLRPEDGAWSLDGMTFYFVTTASPTTASRLWALEFKDIANPELGGTVKLLLDGSEGQVMFDNITVTHTGRILLQEDPGNIARAAKIWSYDLASDQLTEIAQHNPALFTGTGAITQDEESSGILDVTQIFAGQPGYDTGDYGYYLVADQIHAALATPASAVENGQLALMATLYAFG